MPISCEDRQRTLGQTSQKEQGGFIIWIMFDSVTTHAASLDETLNHIIAARDLEYTSSDLYEDLRNQIEEIRRLLNDYITWLKTKKVGENEPGAKMIIRELPAEYLVEVME